MLKALRWMEELKYCFLGCVTMEQWLFRRRTKVLNVNMCAETGYHLFSRHRRSILDFAAFVCLQTNWPSRTPTYCKRRRTLCTFNSDAAKRKQMFFFPLLEKPYNYCVDGFPLFISSHINPVFELDTQRDISSPLQPFSATFPVRAS